MREEQEELYLIPYRQAAEVLPEHLRRAALAPIFPKRFVPKYDWVS